MKKIIFILITSFFINISFAQYTVLINNGIQKESISFKNKQNSSPTPAIPKPVDPVCKYSYPTDYWLAGRNTAYNIIHVVDNNVFVYNKTDIGRTELIIGNVKYTRGTFIGNFGDYARYNICKLTL